MYLFYNGDKFFLCNRSLYFTKEVNKFFHGIAKFSVIFSSLLALIKVDLAFSVRKSNDTIQFWQNIFFCFVPFGRGMLGVHGDVCVGGEMFCCSCFSVDINMTIHDRGPGPKPRGLKIGSMKRNYLNILENAVGKGNFNVPKTNTDVDRY